MTDTAEREGLAQWCEKMARRAQCEREIHSFEEWKRGCENEAIKLKEVANLLRESSAPILLILHCPKCGRQHVDAAEPERGWHNPPHKSHLCHACGCVWRPADVPTTGIAAIATRGAADTWPAPPSCTPPIPAGWRLVPVEPTDEMLGIIHGCAPHAPLGFALMVAQADYKRLLAAAPQPKEPSRDD